MIRVVPVMDLQQGVVVRGIAGRRAEYRPVQSTLTPLNTPQAVTKALHTQFGFRRFYLADLDAIAGAAPQERAWQETRAAESELWIDAGVGHCELARQHGDVVLGLESLASPEELARLVEQLSPQRTLFSLDLFAGQLWTSAPAWQGYTPMMAAEVAVECGLRRLILLDVADVGMHGGTSTLALAMQLLVRWPDLELIGGGGVRGVEDLQALDRAGFAHALVASALHDGRLTFAALRDGGFLS